MKRRESEVAGIPRARQSSRGNDWDEWMEGLADHNFITSHGSDAEMSRNCGSDIFFPLLLSFSLSLPQSLSRSRGNIGNYVSRPILNRYLTWKSLSTLPNFFPTDFHLPDSSLSRFSLLFSGELESWNTVFTVLTFSKKKIQACKEKYEIQNIIKDLIFFLFRK